MERKLTYEKLQTLKLVQILSEKNEFKIAPISELIEAVTSTRDVKSGAVRKMVWELNKLGYLENPLRGCWRLTEKGKQVLEEI